MSLTLKEIDGDGTGCSVKAAFFCVSSEAGREGILFPTCDRYQHSWPHEPSRQLEHPCLATCSRSQCEVN